MDRLSGILIAFVVLVLPSAFLLIVGSRRFRRLMAKTVIVVVVFGIGAYYYAATQDHESRSRIRPSELTLQNLDLDSQFGNYRLRGRVTNHSTQFTVKCMTLEILATDCPTKVSKDKCRTIGDEKENVCVDVPPGKSGDFETYVYFRDGKLQPTGRLAFHYKVSDTYSE